MAEDIRKALLAEGIDTVARAQTLRRMIVLPFRMVRRSDELEFLTYSLPESITVSLSGLENLVVRSSIIAARYAQDVPDFQKIASEAEVDVILTGALLPVGEQIRITAQLVQVPDGAVLWSHSSEANVKELLQLHDTLVDRVVQQVLPQLSPHDQAVLHHDRPASPTVYQLYLRANECSREWENLPAAIQLYEDCVRLDSRYAPAWARLGRARWLCDKYTLGSAEGLRSADDAFQKAFELSPDLPLAHHFYTYLQVDQGRSLQALQRLLDLSSRRHSDPELFAALAHVCRYCGLLQPALFAHHEARRLDPQVPTTLNHTYFMLGDYERALQASQRDFGYGTALTLALLDRTPEAIAMLRQQEDSSSWRLGKLFLISMRALLEGNREESLQASGELVRATFRDPEGLYYQARQLSYLGADDWALELFQRAVDHGFFCYQAFVRDPWLDRLRGKLAFQPLCKGLPASIRKPCVFFAPTSRIPCSASPPKITTHNLTLASLALWSRAAQPCILPPVLPQEVLVMSASPISVLEHNKQLTVRWFADVWNQSRRDVIFELLAPDFVLHEGHTPIRGPQEFADFYDRLQSQLSIFALRPALPLPKMTSSAFAGRSAPSTRPAAKKLLSRASPSSASKTAVSSKPGKTGMPPPWPPSFPTPPLQRCSRRGPYHFATAHRAPYFCIFLAVFIYFLRAPLGFCSVRNGSFAMIRLSG
jgi:TolB-like protein/tetratricopeptide (TPR) repeat protein